MNVKSLYTDLPNRDSLLALARFVDKRPTFQPPTQTLVRLVELVLTLNTFSFNGKSYKHAGGELKAGMKAFHESSKIFNFSYATAWK